MQYKKISFTKILNFIKDNEDLKEEITQIIGKKNMIMKEKVSTISDIILEQKIEEIKELFKILKRIDKNDTEKKIIENLCIN